MKTAIKRKNNAPKYMKLTKKEAKLLLVSGGLFVLGLVICLVGSLIARGTGTCVYNQTQNDEGNYIYTYDFSGETVKKLTIDIDYTDLNIIGGAEKNRIELINFAQENFNLAASATTVTLGEKSGLSSIFSLNFSGLRNVLHSVNFIGKHKTVNIYLTDLSALKIVTADIFCGEVTLKNCNSDTAYDINISYGDIKAENISTQNCLSLKIEEGNADVSSGVINILNADVTKGYVNLDKSKVTTLDANITTGYFKYLTGSYDLLSSVLKVQTDNGRVRFNNDIYESGKFSQGMKYSGISSVVQIIINVHVGEGNILITE